MKKTIGTLICISMIASSVVCSWAADKEKHEPDVFVDSSRIMFKDQNAVIIDGITLVPARGVFEAMDCEVAWDGGKRTVTVTSSTGVRNVVITIDNDVMRISTFKTLMEIDSRDYMLDVPAQIINDRTMIPLRAVSEAFNCTVEWDDEDYKINITTGTPILLEGYTYTPEPEESKVKMSLSTDHEGDLRAGDEFTVYINADNIPDNNFCSSVVAVFAYDRDKFEYVDGSGEMLNDSDGKIQNVLCAENTAYEKGSKVAFVTIDGEHARKTNGKVFKAIFKSVSGESGTIALSNDYAPTLGYESYLMFTETKENNVTDTIYNGGKLNLDTSHLVIGESAK